MIAIPHILRLLQFGGRWRESLLRRLLILIALKLILYVRSILVSIIALVVCLLVVLLLLRLEALRSIHGHLIVIVASKRHLVKIRLLLFI